MVNIMSCLNFSGYLYEYDYWISYCYIFHNFLGDISKQVEIRKRLQCKPFKWFMETIAFDLSKVYPPIEPPNFSEGAISSFQDRSFCVDAINAISNQR